MTSAAPLFFPKREETRKGAGSGQVSEPVELFCHPANVWGTFFCWQPSSWLLPRLARFETPICHVSVAGNPGIRPAFRQAHIGIGISGPPVPRSTHAPASQTQQDHSQKTAIPSVSIHDDWVKRGRKKSQEGRSEGCIRGRRRIKIPISKSGEEITISLRTFPAEFVWRWNCSRAWTHHLIKTGARSSAKTICSPRPRCSKPGMLDCTSPDHCRDSKRQDELRFRSSRKHQLVLGCIYPDVVQL